VRILGLETSCDETAAAIVEVAGAADERPRGRVLADVVHTQADLHARYGGVVPELARVQHTDAAEVALFEDRSTGRAIVVCAIDNLGKGAAGQAVQNANMALGLEQAHGLRLNGVLV